jgi:hypothetical protein
MDNNANRTATQSDTHTDLRTKIAKILYSQNADEDWNGNEVTWEGTSKAYRECWLHDADVLIAGLALEPHDEHFNVGYRRYITGWIK